MERKPYTPPTMKAVAINNQAPILCGSDPYWNDCEQPNDDEWWRK